MLRDIDINIWYWQLMFISIKLPFLYVFHGVVQDEVGHVGFVWSCDSDGNVPPGLCFNWKTEAMSPIVMSCNESILYFIAGSLQLGRDCSPKCSRHKYCQGSTFIFVEHSLILSECLLTSSFQLYCRFSAKTCRKHMYNVHSQVASKHQVLYCKNMSWEL